MYVESVEFENNYKIPMENVKKWKDNITESQQSET